MQTIVYILSNINKALQYEGTARLMREQGVDLRFILLQPWPRTAMQTFLEEEAIPHVVLPFNSRRQYPALIWKVWRQLRAWKPHAVHCHLMDASFVGLMAARMAGVPMRIHTRHHAIENHKLSKKAVWLDKRINSLSTHIVSISGNVSNILRKMEGVPVHKIVSIPHGFSLERLQQPNLKRTAELRQQHQLDGAYPVIGVISRFLELKGMDYTIAAFQQLLADYPRAVLLFAGVWGDYEAQIDRQLADLPLHSWRKIGFEEDLPALYALLDMHVHVPIARESESFGQTYIEALAAGVPAIFTLSGVAPEVIRHEQNALVVPHRNSDAILAGMRTLLTDESLRQRMVAQGKLDAAPYSMAQMVRRLLQLYGQAAA